MDSSLSLSWRLFWRALITMALFSVISSAFYILKDGRFSFQAIAFVLAIVIPYLPYCAPLRLIGIHGNAQAGLQRLAFLPNNWSCAGFLTLIAAIAIDTKLFMILHAHATVESIVSPWQVLSGRFFVAYAVATGLLFVATRINSRLRIAAIVLHTLLFLSIASHIYPLGFGFDGFIHRATEQTILDHGVIAPKTPYYIGQYMVSTFFAHILGVSVDSIDRWLVPILASIVLALGLYWIYRRTSVSAPLQRTLLLLLIPLPLFVSTTPQALSLLFLWLTIAISIENTSATRLNALTFALASSVIHPLSGIPALVYVGLLAIDAVKHAAVRRILFTLGSLIGALLLPIAAFIQMRELPRLSDFLMPLQRAYWYLVTVPPPDAPAALQLVYSYKHLFLPVLFVSVVAAYVLFLRKREGEPLRLPLMLAAMIALSNALLFATTKFPLVITYEQGSYSQRLAWIAGMFVAPYFFLGIVHLARAPLLRLEKSPRYILIALFLLASTSALYLTYPRPDRVELSKGYSTSAHDFQAIDLIAQDAQGHSYLVLANQAVSAAAARMLLFSPSVQLDSQTQFIYPIPTGGALYPYYLRMVYDSPSDMIAQELKNKTGVKRVYFVLNHYWTNAKEIRKAADRSAATSTNIAEKIWIFRY